MLEINVDKFPDVVYVKMSQRYSDTIKTIANSIKDDVITVSQAKYKDLINFLYEALTKPIPVKESTYWDTQEQFGQSEPVVKSLAHMYVENKNENSPLKMVNIKR